MTHKIITVLAVLLFSFAFTTNSIVSENPELVTSSDLMEKTLVPTLSVEEEINQLYTLFSEKNTSLPNLESFKKRDVRIL